MSFSGPTLLSARLVNSLRTHLETDLTILARIHYKNHSQHHLALFWRRVVEVDRVGRRLLPAVGPGLKEGASHAEVRRLAQLTSRLFLAASHLHEHALPILNLTHFLPLITTLIAIASRVWSLCGILYGHIAAAWQRDFPVKRPLPSLEGWPAAPAAVSSKLMEADSSSTKLPLLAGQPSSGPQGSPLPPALAVETGQVVQRSLTQTPASSAPGSSVASPAAVDLGERIVRPKKLKPSPLAPAPANYGMAAVAGRVQTATAAPARTVPPSAASSPTVPSPAPSPLPPSPPLAKVKARKRPLAAVEPADDITVLPTHKAKKPLLGKQDAAATPTSSPFDSLLVPKKPSAAASLAEGVVKKKKRIKRPAGDEIDDIFG